MFARKLLKNPVPAMTQLFRVSQKLIRRPFLLLEMPTKSRRYSLRHRKCGVRGYMHELFVSETQTSEVRASDGF